MKIFLFLSLLTPLFAQIEGRQEAYIKSGSPCPCLEENFGREVAISYPWAVVSSPNEDSDATGINGDPHNENDPGSGAAYVYFHDGSEWIQHTYLKASNPSVNFGSSVAIEGDTIAIGADGEKSNATGVNGDQTDTSLGQAGAVYVFTRDASDSWSQQAYLKASNTREGTIAGNSGALFGSAVAISGDTLVVGAEGEKSNATGVDGDQTDTSLFRAGAAYIFTRDSAGTWSQQAYLKASNTTESDDFGTSVDIDGDIVVIGASSEDSANPGVNPADPSDSPDHQTAGAAYVFSRTGSTWTFRAHLKSAAPQDFGLFGISVSICGETIAVGAPYELDQGRTYIFERSGPTWVGQAIISPIFSSASDQKFGRSVSLSEDNLLIGAFGHLSDSGRADLFRRDASNTWNHLTEISAANSQGGDFFGDTVSLDGFRAIVGAHREDGVNTGVNPDVFDNANANVGAAYTFSFTRPLQALSHSSSKNEHSIIFIADPEMTGWQLHGDDRFGFRKDYTAITTFTEISAGRYQAKFTLDLQENPKHFFRITAPE